MDDFSYLFYVIAQPMFTTDFFFFLMWCVILGQCMCVDLL